MNYKKILYYYLGSILLLLITVIFGKLTHAENILFSISLLLAGFGAGAVTANYINGL